MVSCFTIDIEPDFGVKGEEALTVLPDMLSFLDRHSIHATCFVVSSIAVRYPKLMQHIKNHGHEIAAHGHDHIPLDRCTDQGLENHIIRCRKDFDSIGIDVKGFRPPYFRMHPKMGEILVRHGFQYISGSTYSMHAIPRIEPEPSHIRSIQVTRKLVPHGLPYLRLFPALISMMKKDLIFYCHLHEFLGKGNILHRINAGSRAWSILERIMHQSSDGWITCSEMIQR